MALVREDTEGLFVIVGGWIARPPTPQTTHPRARGLPRAQTALAVGDKPRASHSGGHTARVGGDLWFIDRQARNRTPAHSASEPPSTPAPHTTGSRAQTTTRLASNTSPVATTTALDSIYVIANAVSGEQFVIYAPGGHDERGMYTVAHVSGGTGEIRRPPRIHLVHPDDIAAYATGAADRMRRDGPGHAVSVWLDRTTGPLHEHLTR
ncbi:hypothetical protein ATM97_28655 [Nocardia sp. MH4]|uniref:hypothetical protein n=1 Tax=Nocardia sp. MH4 TaxID=1768677 RepID=UPI001C4F39CD|nr:hypothetical protein [Nocardia sp. MH4]MBW0275173.1 hypothetical protein [Nocardia sp. MH4]